MAPAGEPSADPGARGARLLDRSALGATLVFASAVATTLWLDLRALAFLPGDPDAFFAESGDRVAPFLLPLGFAVFTLWMIDMARAPDLRGARARLRIFGIVTLVSMSLLGGVTDALFDRAVAASELPRGEALLAAAEPLAPMRWLGMLLLSTLAATAIAAYRSQPPPTPAPEGPEGRYRSAWLAPVFGATPALPARQWQIIGLMVAAGLFNAYDMQIFSMALKQIQAGLGLEEARLGLLGSLIRLGTIPGAILALLADSLGRRRLLLITIVGYTLSTGATAIAPNETVFVACQFLARVFGSAEAILAGVVVAEEVDAEHRGWAIGVLAALSFLGVALAWVLFSTVEVLPGGWRTLYAVGLGPLLLIIWLRRRLPETHRFEARRAVAATTEGGGFVGRVIEPAVALVRMYPGRVLAASGVAFLMSFSGQSAGFFFPKFMQEAHGLAPDQLTLVGAGVGLAGLIGMPLLGRVGDRRGRKPVTILFIVLNPLTVMGLYLSGGLALPLLFFLGVTLSDIGSDTNLATFAREIFPTSHRSTASGFLATVGQIGGSLGLAMESVLYGVFGSHAHAISLLAIAGLLAPFLVAFGYPETGSRELEEISPEK